MLYCSSTSEDLHLSTVLSVGMRAMRQCSTQPREPVKAALMPYLSRASVVEPWPSGTGAACSLSCSRAASGAIICSASERGSASPVPGEPTTRDSAAPGLRPSSSGSWAFRFTLAAGVSRAGAPPSAVGSAAMAVRAREIGARLIFTARTVAGAGALVVARDPVELHKAERMTSLRGDGSRQRMNLGLAMDCDTTLLRCCV
ncbi:hypothetical protein V8C86DRAFT_2490350 [Haematococcus lacustris]